jgi:2-polyprenyl-3-methyl-5-hydroxy-6-metoxy-1,4-benzoquinol methylase
MGISQQTVTNKELLGFLKSLKFNSGFIDRLKIYYRPLVCPFTDLIGMVKQGEKVGDIGCGSGQFLLLVSQFTKAGSLYGIEINERLVNNANQLFEKYSNHSSYNFEQFDGVVFPANIKEMDTIFLIDVLHHVPVPVQKQFVTNIIQNMKSGARLVIKDIDAASPFVYCNKLHDLIFAGKMDHELPAETVRLWVEDCKLSIIEFSKKRMYVYPHYTIVATKP